MFALLLVGLCVVRCSEQARYTINVTVLVMEQHLYDPICTDIIKLWIDNQKHYLQSLVADQQVQLDVNFVSEHLMTIPEFSCNKNEKQASETQQGVHEIAWKKLVGKLAISLARSKNVKQVVFILAEPEIINQILVKRVQIKAHVFLVLLTLPSANQVLGGGVISTDKLMVLHCQQHRCPGVQVNNGLADWLLVFGPQSSKRRRQRNKRNDATHAPSTDAPSTAAVTEEPFLSTLTIVLLVILAVSIIVALITCYCIKVAWTKKKKQVDEHKMLEKRLLKAEQKTKKEKEEREAKEQAEEEQRVRERKARECEEKRKQWERDENIFTALQNVNPSKSSPTYKANMLAAINKMWEVDSATVGDKTESTLQQDDIHQSEEPIKSHDAHEDDHE